MAQIRKRLKELSSAMYTKKTKKLTFSSIGHGRPIIVFFPGVSIYTIGVNI